MNRLFSNSRIILMLFCGVLLTANRLEAQNAFDGVWRAGNDPYYLWIGANWNDFKSKWDSLSGQNLRLVDLEIYNQGGQQKFMGVWRGGSDAHYLWVGANWNDFKAKWDELSKQNLRLTIVRTYVEGGARKYAGVWRAGSDAHYLWAGVDWNSFKAKWDELSNQGLRLVDIETYLDIGGRKYIGVWRAGNDAHYLWAGVDWNSFKAKWEELGKQNLRLTVLRTYEEGGQRKYTGVWRAGSDAYYLWAGGDYENFTSKWHQLAGQHLRLVSVATYPGCGDCANHVVASKAYDYGITGHDTVYHWPVDVDGGDKWVRLSAVEVSAAPFTLPFSNPSVKRWNGWLYSPGSWHHAVDYAIDLNQTFQVKAAAAGKVIFSGWDNWSGNTIVISHNVGGKQDAFRTIYMHLRSGPAHDCGKAWSGTVPSLAGDTLTNYKGHLNATGCPSNVANRNPNATNWGTNAQTVAVAFNQQVTAGQVLGWAGDTGPGGNGSSNATTNTHLHIFFTAKDPANGQFYFFDPYGIYGYPSCYPTATTGATGGVCARYPIAWKGGAPAYP